jgi:transcriptional regulator with XRE-family HTH domain
VSGKSKIRYQRQLDKFTAALRELRRRAGNPTLRTMSRRCKNQVSVSTLQRVDTGKGVPRLESVLWYVKACDGDEDLWRQQYSDLETAVRTGSKPRFVPWVTYSDAKKPITDASALRREMRNLKLGSGLTLKEIAEQTEGNRYIAAACGVRGLSISTIGDLCNPKQTHIPRRTTLHAFLLALGVERKDVERWMAIRSELAVRQDERRGKGSSREVSAHSAPSSPQPGSAIRPQRRKVAPKVDPITRFRLLRNDMAHGTLNSPERVLNVLVGIGLPQGEAQALTRNRTVMSAFVMYLDQEMHQIMAGGRVTSTGASVALELALYRTMTRFRPFLEPDSESGQLLRI